MNPTASILAALMMEFWEDDRSPAERYRAGWERTFGSRRESFPKVSQATPEPDFE